jgi:hypothetical protein
MWPVVENDFQLRRALLVRLIRNLVGRAPRTDNLAKLKASKMMARNLVLTGGFLLAAWGTTLATDAADKRIFATKNNHVDGVMLAVLKVGE